MHDKAELVQLMMDYVRDVKVAILKKDRENVLYCERNKLNSARESMLKGHIDIFISQLRLYDEAEVAESKTTYDEKKTLRISHLKELFRNVQNKFVEEGKLYIKALSMTFSLPVENGPYGKLTSGAKITEFLENVYDDKESALEDFTEFKNEVKQHFSLYSRMNTREDEIPIKQEPLPSPARESYPFVAPIIKREQPPSPSPTQDIPANTCVHEASEDVSENVDSANEPEEMEVNRVTEYNDEEEGYEEPDHHLVDLGYKSAQPEDTTYKY
ncbi:uncharacterized protein EV154DRAFT_585842 [Mucor mucedo]|uniref:uncharacterized protein n=1 Tax=Mucor mucedo TaxID=29922 RepID=UPI00221F8C6B|nr:uncharacterized protein EV154DRAFT_585842 [Mucor mucedo]KAI7892629.1 hypothetical protein EV154DRAFT_585842 [Mucor mucedo]